ncbi:MAG: hypothetical protein KAU06_01960, partial [Candidatus Marinimicrobia bacterium]|nr:hypothetical protein [Candidatus Neomarinimicrobiota bacterium]
RERNKEIRGNKGNKGKREILMRFLIYQKPDKIYQMKSYTPYILSLYPLPLYPETRGERNKGIREIVAIRKYGSNKILYPLYPYTPYLPISRNTMRGK